MTAQEATLYGSQATPSSWGSRPWVAWVSLCARFILAAIWIVSGSIKMGDQLTTTAAVHAYRVLPQWAEQPVAIALPVLEIALGVFLLLGIRQQWMAIASALAFIVFIAMIAQAWIRGFHIDCGCFGGGGVNPDATAVTYLSEIARDCAFLVVAVWLSCFPRTRWALDPHSRLPVSQDSSER